MISNCCVCGGEAKTVLTVPFLDILGKPDNTIWQNKIALCRNCGFIFQQNPFTEQELENRYKNFSKYIFDQKKQISMQKTDYDKKCWRQKHFLEENILDNFSSLFEIGAASGYNLSIWGKEKTVYGVEPSSLNCKLAKKNYNIEMFNGMFSDYLLKNKTSSKQYDLIFMSHVLEHIVNPFQFICDCATINNKYFFIEVPTLDYKYIEEPFGMICEEHVNLFTLEGLSSLMNKVGFELMNSEIIFEPNEHIPAGWPAISTIWKKTKGTTPPPLHKKRYTITSEYLLEKYISVNQQELKMINKKIEQIPSFENLALWGMGHHVSMLLANTCLKNKKIVKMYDSDNRKHGKRIMNIPITPFNISDIKNNEVEAILITSYVAQKAIKDYIEKICPKIKIYTLYEI